MGPDPVLNEAGKCRQSDVRPISEFDPSKPALVHDQLNDDTFEWQSEKSLEHYRQYAHEHATGLIAWDGLLLDGWRPLTK